MDQATITAFNQLIQNFEYEKAQQQFYHEELIKHENENAPTIGLVAHRNAMQHFLDSITNESATPLQVIISDDISVTEWHYQFDHKDWGHRDFRQVSVQRWKDGKIVHERHHYKTQNW
ncbi:MAG: ester cyclase [Bacteroidota bacterium]